LLNGLYKEWYENGQLEFEENYNNGKKDGLQKHWEENGQLKYNERYKEGVSFKYGY